MAQSIGVDGIDVPGVGWTNQQYSSVESYPGPAGAVFNSAAQAGYLGWTGLPADAISTFSPASATSYIAKIFVPAGGTSTKIDVNASTVGTVSAAYFGLYNAAGAQVAATAEDHSSWAANRNSIAWVSSVLLAGSTFYYVVLNLTWSVQPVLSAMTVSAVQNFGPVNSVAGTNTFATTGTNTVPLLASYTMTSQTPSALAIPFIAIF
jgi:hypothetical protein